MLYDRSYYIEQSVPIEPELKSLFSLKAPLIIFDIGACEGEETIKYARIFPNSSIYAFEPLPANQELIRDNFAKYGVKNAVAIQKALSFSTGITTFYVSSGKPENAIPADWDFGNKSSSLLPPAKHLQAASFIHFDEKIEVETITLNSFCSQNNITKIDFIHMDVQGAELMVLEGAGNFINSIKAIWLEVSRITLYKNQPLVNDIAEFMKRKNFILLKDDCGTIQGDQLYVSCNFFSKGKITRIKNWIAARSLLKRFLRKVNLTALPLFNRKS